MNATISSAPAFATSLERIWAQYGHFTLVVAGIIGLFAGQPAAAQTGVYQMYYVPMPEQTVTDFNRSLVGAPVDDTVRTVLSISVVLDGTQIWYDQREDGLEAFLTSPSQDTTAVWGDGDPTNGFPPGYPDDLLEAGDVIILDETYNVTTAGACSFADDTGTDCRLSGGDRFGSNKALAVTRSAWNNGPGTVLAGATEVEPVSYWSDSYILPLGQDTATSKDLGFQTVWAVVNASEPDTEVQFNGGPTVVLQPGEVEVFTGVMEGDSLIASAPIQVNLLTGTDATYESRWYRVPPSDQWAAEYYSAVGTTDSGSPAHYYLFNPGGSAIDVVVEYSPGATDTLTVAPGGGAEFTGTASSGLRFQSSGGEPFYVMGSVDADGASSTHDWGFSLVPASTLTGQTVLGWAPGDEDRSNPNYSPVWVTVVDDTTLCVDYDRDGSIDLVRPTTRLEMVRLTDNSDNDMTGALIYSINNGSGTCDTTAASATQTDLAVAWGQDPQFATTGSPALDLGTTVLGVPNYAVSKRVELLRDADNSGHITPGDTIRFIIEVDNYGALPLNNAELVDTMPEALDFDPAGSDPDWNCSDYPVCTLGTFSVAPFSSVTYDLAATIPAVGQTASLVDNTVTLNPGGGLETSTGEASASVEYADVTVALDFPASASPGGLVSGYVRFGNVGTLNAASTEYRMQLPAGLSGVACDGATCHYDPVAGIIVVSGLPTALSPGQWTSTVALGFSMPPSGPVPVDARVTTSSLQPVPHEPDASSASVAVASAVTEADVISRVDPPSVAAPASTVTVPVTYANLGPATASVLDYGLYLPPGLSGVSCTPGISCSYNASTGAITVNGLPSSLAAGESTHFDLVYTAPASGPVVVESSVFTGSDESVTANNPDSGATAVTSTASADVSTSVAPPSTAVIGETVSVPVRYANVGANNADNIDYRLEVDPTPGDISISHGGSPCSYNPVSGAISGCGLPSTLIPGQVVDLTLEYVVDTAGTIEVISTIATESPEDYLLNNVARAATSVAGTDLAISLDGLKGLRMDAPYSGYFSCTNIGEADANSGTRCAVSGLPAGLETNGCRITPDAATWGPGDSVPAGQTVRCEVTGKVSYQEETAIEGLTGADGDMNPANNWATRMMRASSVAMPVPALGTWGLLALVLMFAAVIGRRASHMAY